MVYKGGIWNVNELFSLFFVRHPEYSHFFNEILQANFFSRISAALI